MIDHMMLTDEQTRSIKRLLLDTGHLAMPFGEPQPLPGTENLDSLPIDDPAVRAAIESYQHFMVLNLEHLVAKHHPERRSAAPRIDGKIGPATLELMEQPRCGMPDYAIDNEATGGGQWRSCHNIGSFHGAIVKVMTSPPSHLKRSHESRTVWDDVKKRCRECYAEVGLRFWFSDDSDAPTGGGHQTELSFVGGGSGWIGLALIGQGEQCSSRPIWLRLVSTYLQSSSITDGYLRLWANLLIHELGHNCGSGHTSGGIMNPSIMSVPNRWIGDPAESRMKNWFGGQPVPLDDDQPPPPGPGEMWTGSIKSGNKSIAIVGVSS